MTNAIVNPNGYDEFARVNDKDSLIEDVVTAYQRGKIELHVCGSRVLFHMFKHGDIGPINKLNIALGKESNEAKKFRVWVGDMTRLPDPDQPGKWLSLVTYKEKEGGFRLTKGTGPMRDKVSWHGDYEALKTSASHFMDYKRPKSDEELDTLDMIESILKFSKRFNKQKKDHGMFVHADILNALDTLKARAEAHLEPAKQMRKQAEEDAKRNPAPAVDAHKDENGDYTF